MRRPKLRIWVLILVALSWPGPVFAQVDDVGVANLPRTNFAEFVNRNLVQIDKPADNTTGLVVLGNKFVACYQEFDSDKKVSYVVIAYRVNNNPWEVWTRFEGIPGPIAWDGEHLWVVDSQEGVIARYDTAEAATGGSVVPVRSVEIPIPPAAIRDPPAISGLTWDGQALWLSTDCGLCSGVFRVNPKDGEVLQAFFPKCMPRGLAYRRGSPKAADELLMAAYLGPGEDSLLSNRSITGDGVVVGDSLRFRRFRTIGEETQAPRDPTSIAIQGNRVWVVDRSTDSIVAYELPRTGWQFNDIKDIKTYIDSPR